jgi:3',5'-cyclic AMP phosphodiesterase CpdA
MRFLHFSDVHVTQDYFNMPLRRLGWRRALALFELSFGGRAKRYANSASTISRIVADRERHEVDHLILSGDLTAYATEWEFDRAREALGELAHDRTRITIIPGNHDVYTPGAYNTRRFERYFGHLLQSDLPEYTRDGPFPFVRLLGDEVAIVGLMSARVPPMPGFSFGVIGKKQLGGLRDVLADPRLNNRVVLVVVHHAPLAPSGRKDRFLHGLMDADVLMRLCQGPRFAVLHGHIHKRYHHAATDKRPHTFGAGSSTEGGHEGYWIIDVVDGAVKSWSPQVPTGLGGTGLQASSGAPA